MKYLICQYCFDVVKLVPATRACSCGHSWGHFSQHCNDVSIGGEGWPFHFDAKSMVRTIKDCHSARRYHAETPVNCYPRLEVNCEQ